MALTITLPDHIKAYIERQVAEGRFESEDAMIVNAVEQVMDEYRWEEDEDLLEAIAEYERDGGEEWTPELMAAHSQQRPREAAEARRPSAI